MFIRYKSLFLLDLIFTLTTIMMMPMVFSKEERLLLLGAGIIILLCIPVSVLSQVSSSRSLSNYGQISILGREYPSSTFTYRIFQNSTSAYRINSTGFVDDHYGDPAVVINNAMQNCSAARGGSVYVVPDTYQTATPLGSTSIWGNWTNIYVCFGDGTIFNYSSNGNRGAFLFNLVATGAYVVNCTFTSNGTAYFNGNNVRNGWSLQNIVNSTFSNFAVQHTYGDAIMYKWMRYCDFKNLTIFSFDEGEPDNGGFVGNDMQYCTFKNMLIDGNNNPNTRAAVYMGDWEPHAVDSATTLGVGNCFNNWSNIWIKNNKRTGFYLNSGCMGWQVYNNTFTNCTIENNWESAYPAIKLRPAQNNTFTDIVIRNMTDAVTTGTSILGGETPGNCTGNSITATIDGCTVSSFILTTDDNSQSVDHNFFNLTITNSKRTYFASGTNSPIHDNTAYLSFTNCQGGLYFESGYFSNNIFVCNFSNTLASGAGKADIWFYNNPNFDPNITGNRIYVIEHGSNTFLNFTNGTRQNYVYYPWNS